MTEARGNSQERALWLHKAAVMLTPLIDGVSQHGNVPDNLRYSVGFPKGGGGKGATTIGQCWGPQSSADGHAEIFISPVLGVTDDSAAFDETVNVLQILAHELIHACVGVEAGHKKPFKQVAVAIGLEGKMTATVAGPLFVETVRGWIGEHGFFPMGKLAVAKRGSKGSRLVKCECSDCGYVARVTRKWLDQAGAPICPIDAIPFTCD
jgi:hypothetical protein